MDYLIIGIVTFFASCLTLYSGFGLGTLLLPAFTLFFPLPLAIAATAIVHLLNNLFKGSLVWRNTHWGIVKKFGLPAIPGALLGAFLVNYFSAANHVLSWHLLGHDFSSSVMAIIIGVILYIFAILEFRLWFQRLSFPEKYLSIGGFMTGFMGGISGQQGVMRSMFLLKSNLSGQQYIATGIFIAVLIDIVRIPTYFLSFNGLNLNIKNSQVTLIGAAVVFAFLGAWIGTRFMKKVTLTYIRIIVAVLMIVIGTLLIVGIIGS